MRKLFGTDGIRGKANIYPITPETALLVGKATAACLGSNQNDKHRRVIVGKDTRLSGYMLESAITSGILSVGVDVLAVGPMPTPAVAHLTKSMGAVCGIMITASHNPASDNGIKIFGADGFKLPDAVEADIEKRIENSDFGKIIASERIGKAFRIDDARGRYIEFSKSSIRNYSLNGMKIVVDCANGAAYSIAPLVLRELGADVVEIGVQPNGSNINLKCGALYPESMCRMVRECGADAGIALDGDADRVIFCDENGNIVDGDRIIGMLALDYKQRGKLAGNSIVVTSMSNMGLLEAMTKAGINTEITDVGDRYVIERMKEGDFNIGGEQSGHIIFMDYATTGDGLISALHVLKYMKKQNKRLSELANFMRVFPQQLVSLEVENKRPVEELVQFGRVVESCRQSLGSSGRVIVRYSGTENKIRLLVEASSVDKVEHWMARLVDAASLELAVKKDGKNG